MKLAFVHDWLISETGGAEKVLQSLCELYHAPIFTLLQDPQAVRKLGLDFEKIHSSFLQKFPFAKTKYRSYFPFYPLAVEGFDLSEYDLVLSCSHSVAKGVLTHADQYHICYCHTPVRYAWDLYHQYLKEVKGLRRRLAKFFLHYLRMWDVQAANRVDRFVVNSKFVSKRIRKIYGKEAEVIYPPVDTDYFSLKTNKEEYYVTASRMVSYKKIDLIVEAFSRMPDKKLVVIGDGPDFDKVKSKAAKNIELLGYRPDETLREHLQKAKAFVFAAIEDFGILPVEAQSCGTPVIAYGKGAVLETVLRGTTGIFYQNQTPEAIVDSVKEFEKLDFDYSLVRKHAEAFCKKRFQDEMQSLIEETYQTFAQT